MTNYNNPTTQADRTSTFLDHVSNDSGGRYAAIGKPTVIGRDPAQYPKLPASSPFAADPVGVEPPTGVDINAMEPVGEPFEIEASLATSGAPTDANPTSVVVEHDVANPHARLAEILPKIAIRRRKL